ncbi:hypothetical protein PFICI_13623 [Pestalotiopsis fici W106-1]|uniref:Mid2 domain-containing protein n=1 Tax=Pestalotiopsis fici (strain W106-1 / CGMCC3.15140) TaxID=1229662 RepID=W3WMY2_PESFW|nr:uncharacterized protein PFICI_13623 [Pestalotiopsis fici W106-1]ETS75139.1 hypothetical protein PFICI_13623 [Pestalotiopsis fici W106-1]
MRCNTSIILAAAWGFIAVWAESYATFYKPTYHSTYRTDSIYGDAEVFKLGSSQVIDFDTPWSEWSMYLVQYLPNSDQDIFGYTTIVEQTSGEVLAKTFNWTVQLYDIDLAASPIFYIYLYNDDLNVTDDDYMTSSAYFNITEADTVVTTATGTVAAATASGSHPAQTAILTPTTTATSDSSSTTSSSNNANGNNNQNQNSGGLSTGAQVGIGLGVGISGLAAIVCAAVLFFYIRRNNRRNTEAQQQLMTARPTEPPVYHSGYPSGYQSGYSSGYPSPYQPSEMLHDQQTAYQQQQQKQDQPEMRVASELYAPPPSESALPNSPHSQVASYR